MSYSALSPPSHSSTPNEKNDDSSDEQYEELLTLLSQNPTNSNSSSFSPHPTRPSTQHLHSAPSLQIYQTSMIRHGDFVGGDPPPPQPVVLKMPLDSDLDTIARLNNEYNILTRHFNVGSVGNICGSKSVRMALERVVDRENGQLRATMLEYIDGDNLMDWLVDHSYQNRCKGFGPSEEELLLRVKVAAGVVGALADVHEAGVVHNDILPSSFLILESFCEEGEDAGDAMDEDDGVASKVSYQDSGHLNFDMGSLWTSPVISVKIVSFGYATYGRHSEADDFGESVNDDLPALGNVLCTLFTDISDVDDCNMNASGLGGSSSNMTMMMMTRDEILGFGSNLTLPMESSQGAMNVEPEVEEEDEEEEEESPDEKEDGSIRTNTTATTTSSKTIFSSTSMRSKIKKKKKKKKHESSSLRRFASNISNNLSTSSAFSSTSIVPDKIPQSIRNLLSNLTNADWEIAKECPYANAREIHEDLNQMLDDPVNFLYDPLPDMKLDELNLTKDKLYGRDKEILVLEDACRRIISQQQQQQKNQQSSGNSQSHYHPRHFHHRGSTSGNTFNCDASTITDIGGGSGHSHLQSTRSLPGGGTIGSSTTGGPASNTGNMIPDDVASSVASTSISNVSSCSEFILVHGKSGVGKSELVRKVCQSELKESNGYFLQGKFDQMHTSTDAGDNGGVNHANTFASSKRGQSSTSPHSTTTPGCGTQPYSAFLVAFSDLCDKILAKGQPTINEMSNKIKSAIGSLGRILTNEIPALTQIIGPQPEISNIEIDGTELQNRFHFVFRLFVRAIAKPEHPVILLVDDLQWADSASLKLVEMLVKDSARNNTCMLLVGCYRDDEESRLLFDRNHPLTQSLERMERKGTKLKKIQVDDLGKKAVNHLISDALRMSRRLTRPLADIVFRKTNGNAFFVVELLKSLCDDKILKYSKTSKRWVWDEEGITSQDISDNVVGLVASKIQKFPNVTQEVLKTVAGIGSYFDINMVKPVLIHTHILDQTDDKSTNHSTSNSTTSSSSSENDDFDHKFSLQLQFLIQEGLIDKLHNGTLYKFAHDRIQQAAYSLIPTHERKNLHLTIGRLLLEICEQHQDQSDKLLFVAADQMNRAYDLLTTEEECIRLAEWNLQAGEMAMKSSAFGPAAGYLRAGIRMLLVLDEDGFLEGAGVGGDSVAGGGRGYDKWERHYDLSLRLYSNLAESECCNGTFDTMDDIVKEAIRNAKSIHDKFSPYSSLMTSTMFHKNPSEAFAIGLDVLSQLGESFPTKVSTVTVVRDMMKTRVLLRGKSDVSLTSLPTMQDRTKILAMNMMSNMTSIAIYGASEFLPLLTFRMVRLTLRYGACEASALGFTFYGTIMCGVLGDIKGGCRYGQLGLTLVAERFNSNKFLARALTTMVYSVWVWTEPLHSLLEPCMRAYQICMEVGDNEYAMYALWNHCAHSFLSGKILAPLSDDMRNCAQLMTDLGQGTSYYILIPLWQTVLNLMGCSENPTILTGEAMNEDQIVQSCADNPNCICDIYIFRLMLSYLFQDYEDAAAMAEKSKDASEIHPGIALVWLRSFYEGLTCFALARKTGKKKWLTRGRNVKRTMKKWAEHCPATFYPKYKLLYAENTSVKGGKKEFTIRAYDDAVKAANDSNLIHEEALINERAAIYLQSRGDMDMASVYYDRANQIYMDWGAYSKARPPHDNLVEQ